MKQGRVNYIGNSFLKTFPNKLYLVSFFNYAVVKIVKISLKSY